MPSFEFQGTITLVGIDSIDVDPAIFHFEVGKPFSFQLTPKGGTPPYTYTVVTKPAWASVSPTGLVTGTIPSAGNHPISLTVRDSTP